MARGSEKLSKKAEIFCRIIRILNGKFLVVAEIEAIKKRRLTIVCFATKGTPNTNYVQKPASKKLEEAKGQLLRVFLFSKKDCHKGFIN